MLSDTEEHTIAHQKLGAYHHEDGSLVPSPTINITTSVYLYNYGCLSPKSTHPHTFPDTNPSIK
ncbi:hypothetical protein LB505_004323 [Fusarium chuoi]|nr:hypothetical protein LB505_004323 [Fusarium chuoi]